MAIKSKRIATGQKSDGERHSVKEALVIKTEIFDFSRKMALACAKIKLVIKYHEV